MPKTTKAGPSNQWAELEPVQDTFTEDAPPPADAAPDSTPAAPAKKPRAASRKRTGAASAKDQE